MRAILWEHTQPCNEVQMDEQCGGAAIFLRIISKRGHDESSSKKMGYSLRLGVLFAHS
jgi:hypothetical protein